MHDLSHLTINLAAVGGNDKCKEVLEKDSISYRKKDIRPIFLAVADPDPESPGRLHAKKLGLITLDDYHELFDSRYNIDVIIVLVPEEAVFQDILESKPSHIQVISYPVFEAFWKIISVQEYVLKARKEEFETIFNGIQDFIIVINPDMEIMEVNRPFLDEMGYARQDVIGQKCHQIFQNMNQPCTDGKITCPLNEAIRNKKGSQQVLTRVDNYGEKRYIEVSIFPIWEKSGKISRFIEISRDITNRKKDEEEIKQRLEKMVGEKTRQLKDTHLKLLHKDKMASLGKLSASMVHEINNPIAGILNLTMLIRRIIEEDSNAHKETNRFIQYLTLMETETRRISRIVSNLLSFSRHSKIEIKKLNLNRLLEKTLMLNSNLFKINDIRVNSSLEANLPDIVGSEDQLQQVIMNFISNAAEAMEGNSESVFNIKTKYLQKDKKIKIIFEDNGIGIEKEHLARLFEPFFTTKKRGKGAYHKYPLGERMEYSEMRKNSGD